VVAPCSLRALEEALRTGVVGSAIGKAEEGKQRAASALAAVGAACHPLAFSTNGRLSDSAARFVEHLARRWGRAKGWAHSLAMPRLQQNISMAIQRFNGSIFAEASARARG
jgi:hypothetical protein